MEKYLRKYIGAEIKSHMDGFSMSITELSSKTGLSKNYISELINGKKSPSLTTLCRLAVALKTEPEWLIGVA